MEIYKVTNKLNGKCYIGKTIYNLKERKIKFNNENKFNIVLIPPN